MADLGHWITRVHPDDHTRVAGALDRQRAGERHAVEYRIVRPDGAVRHIHDTGFLIFKDGRIRRLTGVAQDRTDQVVVEQALAESELRARTLMDGIPQRVWRAVGEGEWIWPSFRWTDFTGQSAAAALGWGWLQAVHPDDRDAVRAAWREAMRTGRLSSEHRIRRAADEAYRLFQTRAARAAIGDGAEWLGTSTNVQDQHDLQGRQRALLGELQHRLPNTLAVIRSLATSTGDTSQSVEEFVSHLEGRIGALARTELGLTRAPGVGLDLEMLVREELLAQAADRGRIEVSGPDVRLSPKAAEVLTLAIHERSTNALKYGALSTGEGRVSVTWTTFARRHLTCLRLVWGEQGVRVAAAAPRREGFGTELIESRVPYELQGRGRLEFRPGGVRCELVFPLIADDGLAEL